MNTDSLPRASHVAPKVFGARHGVHEGTIVASYSAIRDNRCVPVAMHKL